jgi:uncharacterized protein involved in exopolysaccharide biosynthesis
VEILGQYISEKPVKPRVKLSIAVAGMASMFVGIFFAFFMEYVEKIKK